MRLHPRHVPLLAFLVAAAPLSGAVLQVEGPQDSLAGAPTINHCTLRKAVINSNDDAATYPQCAAGSGADVIEFLFPGAITFALAGINEEAGLTGDLDVTSNITVVGHPDGTVIDGADLDRIFDVKPGATLTLQNIHLRNATALGSAGAILVSSGTLVLDRVTISGCHVNEGDGGAIVAGSSSLTLVNSTLSGNSAAHHGGALVIEGGTAAITNTTITGNSSGFSNLTGGIRNLGTTTLRNSIVAGNAGTDLPNLDGTFTSLGYNLIGELGLAPGNPTIVAATGDQLDVGLAALSLGPLQNNGGSTPTHALLAGSAARDQGHASGGTTDQRGLTRPCDDASIANATGGDGGDIGAYEEQGPCFANVAPDAVDDLASVAEDSGANAIAVLANDTDSNGDPLTVTAVTQGAHGSVTFTAGSVSYTPQANYSGSDSFTYTIDDGDSATDTATVSVTVTSVNDIPVAANDAYVMDQDTILTVPVPGVLGNDSDIDGDSLSASLVTNVAHGTLVLQPDGSFVYTPDAGYAGTDSFTYTAHDASAGSNNATVSFQIADTQPPAITASVATSTLWSPNHKMVDVGLSVSAVDNSSTATTTVAVFSDEDDGETSDASGMLLLRAERAGTGDGRFYLILVTATDSYGNTSSACLTVTVPKSQSAADVASVEAEAAAAQAACTGAGLFVVGDV
jgi:hypothetical protein